jgi:hypothetical protein
MKMLNLKDFEGWVSRAVHMQDPHKVGQGTGVGGLTAVS